MAYRDFTLAKVYRQFWLKERRERLFPEVERIGRADSSFKRNSGIFEFVFEKFQGGQKVKRLSGSMV